jgi:hypothetical protein
MKTRKKPATVTLRAFRFGGIGTIEKKATIRMSTRLFKLILCEYRQKYRQFLYCHLRGVFDTA